MNRQRLKVTIVSADGLSIADINGSADPYVKFYWRNKKYKTQVLRKSLNPIWNETFLLDYEPGKDPSTLLFTICDWDRVGSNEPLRQIACDFSSLQTGVLDAFYNIQPFKGVAQGRLRLKLEIFGVRSPIAPVTPANPQVILVYSPQTQSRPVSLHLPSAAAAAYPYSHPAIDPVNQIHDILTNISKQEIRAALAVFNGDKEKAINFLLNKQISNTAQANLQQQFQPNQPSLGNAPNSSNAGLQSSYSPQQGGGFAPVAPPVMISASVAGAIPDPSLVYSGRGRKKALLIGINYFNTQIALKGCIQDAQRMKSVLTRIYGFPDSPDSIIMLTDDNPDWKFKPTKQNILYAMSWLVQGCVPGDVLFFHFSGHGSQKLNLNGTEDDGYDETILPCDAKQAGVIIDDEIQARLVQPLPSGVRLTAVMDCCHSGTGMDLPFNWDSRHVQWATDSAPFYTAGDVQLFSGCPDDGVSADVSASGFLCTPYGEAGGAMTTAFISAVSSNPYGHTYYSLLEHIRGSIACRGLRQNPQLSSTQAFPINRPFNLTDIVPNKNLMLGKQHNGDGHYNKKQKKRRLKIN